MISNDIKKKIENLFEEKKYEELILFVNKFIKDQDRPPGLDALIGSCFFLKKKKTKEDLINSLKCYEQAFLKGKNSIHGLSGITNYIHVSLIGAQKSNDFLPFVQKAEKYFNESEKYFIKNPDFLRLAKKLFWFQLDNQKLDYISQKMIDNPSVPVFDKSGAIFFYNYLYSWSQKKYSDQVKINSKNFHKLKVKDLEEINFKENDRINLGFVSGDFTDQHSIFYFVRDTLKFLDRNLFRVFLFSFNRGVNSSLGQNQIKNVADEFIDLDKHNNQDCVKIIQNNKINILIDLMGYTFSKRLEIFNSRVAPIQISWLATCNTVGFDTIDYLIADNNLIPKDDEHLYPEKILKLPDIWNVHCGNDIKRKYTKSPCEISNYFTFGSLNNFHKISDEVIEAWSRILKKCDKSKLIIKSSSFETNNGKIFEKFKKYDLENKIEILNIRDFINKNDHLNVYKRIDLGLDTFPYNGVTTTFESLWMGVPVLVLKGFNFNSRCGFSIINNTNFKNLITNNIDEYVDRAIYFYDNREEFIKLKSELFKNILSTPLFNTQRFSKNFAKALLGLIE